MDHAPTGCTGFQLQELQTPPEAGVQYGSEQAGAGAISAVTARPLPSALQPEGSSIFPPFSILFLRSRTAALPCLSPPVLSSAPAHLGLISSQPACCDTERQDMFTSESSCLFQFKKKNKTNKTTPQKSFSPKIQETWKKITKIILNCCFRFFILKLIFSIILPSLLPGQLWIFSSLYRLLESSHHGNAEMFLQRGRLPLRTLLLKNIAFLDQCLHLFSAG